MRTGSAQTAALDLQGHRGCRALLPENTITGFIKALDLGVTTLELDVVISADSQVVVSHEAWMSSEICTGPGNRIPDPSGEQALNFFKMNYAEITGWDCGRRGHPRFPQQEPRASIKPLLRDVFQACEQHVRDSKRSPVVYIGLRLGVVADFLHKSSIKELHLNLPQNCHTKHCTRHYAKLLLPAGVLSVVS